MDHGKRRGQDHGNKKRDGTGSKPQQGGGEKGSGDNLKDKTHAPYPTIVVRYVESELDTEIIDNGATICKLKTAAINAMEDNIRNMNIPGDNVRLKATVVFKLKAIDDNKSLSSSEGRIKNNPTSTLRKVADPIIIVENELPLVTSLLKQYEETRASAGRMAIVTKAFKDYTRTGKDVDPLVRELVAGEGNPLRAKLDEVSASLQRQIDELNKVLETNDEARTARRSFEINFESRLHEADDIFWRSLNQFDRIILRRLYDMIVQEISLMLGYGTNRERTNADHQRLMEHLESDDTQRAVYIRELRDQMIHRGLLEIYQDQRAFGLLRYGPRTARSGANHAAHSADRDQIIAALNRLIERDPRSYHGHAVLVRSRFPHLIEEAVQDGDADCEGETVAETVAEGGAIGGGETVAEVADDDSVVGSVEEEEGDGNDVMHGVEATN